MRYYVRTGRRSAIGMPLWVAVLGWLLFAAAVWAVALAVAAIAAAVVAALLLVALGAWLVGRAHRRSDRRRAERL